MLKIFSLLITAILIANMFAFPTFTTYGENDDSYLWEFNTIGDLEGWILCNPLRQSRQIPELCTTTIRVHGAKAF